MTRRQFLAEKFFAKLQKVEVLTSHGRTAPDVIRAISVSEVSSGANS